MRDDETLDAAIEALGAVVRDEQQT